MASLPAQFDVRRIYRDYGEPMKEMAGFIVRWNPRPICRHVCWSNMGKFIAVGLDRYTGKFRGLSGIPAFVGLALLSSFLCMFIASGSAIWSILAPFSYQCLCYLAFTGICAILFRIADSSTSIALAPVSPFCPTVSWIPATLQTRRETGYLLFVSLALSAYLFWWYGC